MRINGFASGLDIDAMVKQLMTARKAPLNKVNQQKQQLEWKREGYREISTKLVTLNDKLSKLYLSSSIDSKIANVTGANVLTAKATGAATNSVLNVAVESMATATNAVYQGNAGKTILSEYVSGLNAGTNSITIGGENIEFQDTDTVQSLVDKINSNKATGVTAFFDSTTGSLSLTNRNTGNSDIQVGGALFNNKTGGEKGSDAVVTINGVKTSQSSNHFMVNGVEVTLTGVTPNGQSTQIEVTQDIDTMVGTIKSFVEAYNDTISFLNNKTNEELYRKYLPLTSEQREAMKEDEIKLWEEKAKSGMLRNDSIIGKALSDMRTALVSDMITSSGEKLNLAQFGITTGSYSENGKLYIDETKLREAIEKDPSQVATFFGQRDSSGTITDNKNDGIFNRIKKISEDSLLTLSNRAGTSRFSSDLTTAFLPKSEMGDQLKTFENRITELNARLLRIENQYYKQFTAMEVAMNKYNSASSSLSSFL